MRLTVEAWAGAAAAAAALGAGIYWVRRLRRVTPEQMERARRLRLNAMGRIASGEIVDTLTAPGEEALPPVLVYEYEVGGVKYQVSQALHLVAAGFEPESWIPGWPVQVKYDPHNPGNSIVACEHWSGLRVGKVRAAGSH